MDSARSSAHGGYPDGRVGRVAACDRKVFEPYGRKPDCEDVSAAEDAGRTAAGVHAVGRKAGTVGK